MEVRCQCGTVSFNTPTPAPLALYICHCQSCQRQSGSAFGTSAIFPRFTVQSSDNLSCYMRPTASGLTLYCYFCKTCGTRLYHDEPTKDVVSIRGGCIKGLDWSTAIHLWTKSAMVPIPEGTESYPEESPSSASYASAQDLLDQPSSITTPSDTSASQHGSCY